MPTTSKTNGCPTPAKITVFKISSEVPFGKMFENAPVAVGIANRASKRSIAQIYNPCPNANFIFKPNSLGD